ncbi:hypothetical protein H257_04500 [Aphanomyces astaci]|uniref:ATP-dependent RNA helicase n=1 Tax=Aphanomyces astaci TaxID=112090 RepID=W4GW55_APHAT|nr:hypothetical protein H257_04500 [Aphanomyces astaci]ETV83912.1 hypothetical protein H257_04500 [Aphanomyces astaci]RQM23851.1 hypothetical protein B5M09_006395 [Aphanomyces astaci]|eukprot:XP_009827342.1 hypothetical protein H257_04500 [Aphanomyces astaci]
MKFSECKPPLCAEVLAGIEELGFTDMTPVQSATMPLFLTNKDVAVDASTGSGKTLSFVLPTVEMLRRRLLATQDDDVANVLATKKHSQLMAMLLSPTRELARQIYDQAVFFFSRVLPDVHVLLFVGGTSVDEDMAAIRAAKGYVSVIVGTPGRIEDMFNRIAELAILDTKEFEVLILDEADTLLDMGFDISINNILGKLPKQRRTGLFSATQTQEVKALARAGLRNPATVSVQLASNTKTPSTLTNYFTPVEYDAKLATLLQFVQNKPSEKHIVFFSTCASVDFYGAVLAHLTKHSNNVVTLHGKMQPKKRIAHYDEFVHAPAGLLVCTDVVARGIDLPDVDWIIQFDPPQDPNFFVHRVGRTARAGRSGSALTFLSSNEDAYVNFLNIRKVPLTEMQVPVSTEEAEHVLDQVKALQLTDRDVLEKGTKAFISFVRSYKEHQCQFIFRFRDLNLAKVATGFALLQLPKINELRCLDNIAFTPSGVKIVDIPYKDKAREKQRQKKLVEIAAEHKAEKLDRFEKKQLDKKRKAAVDEDGPRRREKKKGMHQQIVEEWEELEKEEHLFKKFKRGKITKEEYDAALGDLSDDETGATKQEKKFIKKEGVKQKTGEQKANAAKREERIRARKKAEHIKRSQQRAKYNGKR